MAGMLCVGLFLLLWVASATNLANNFEKKLKGFQVKTKNSVSTLMNELQSEQLITKEYVNAANTAIDKTFKGRFGEGGSKAIFQALTEANIPISVERFESWSRRDSSRWASLEADQNTMVDAAVSYDAWLGRWQSLPARWVGYPKIKVADYYDIMISEGAANAFETKRINANDVYKKE